MSLYKCNECGLRTNQHTWMPCECGCSVWVPIPAIKENKSMAENKLEELYEQRLKLTQEINKLESLERHKRLREHIRHTANKRLHDVASSIMKEYIEKDLQPDDCEDLTKEARKTVATLINDVVDSLIEILEDKSSYNVDED